MEDSLNAADEFIDSVADDAVFGVTDSNGNIVETLTGAQVKDLWNNTKFELAPNTYDPGNGGAGGGTSPNYASDGSYTGKVTLTPKAVQAYADAARAIGLPASVGISTLIFHELGHTTPGGVSDTRIANPRIHQPDTPWGARREQRTNNRSRTMANIGRSVYACYLGGGCS